MHHQLAAGCHSCRILLPGLFRYQRVEDAFELLASLGIGKHQLAHAGRLRAPSPAIKSLPKPVR